MKRVVSIAFCLFLLAAFVSAQDTPKTINGGVLNGKAVSLPKPVYPPEAKAALQGTVAIKVTIDEEGNVIDAVPSVEKSTTMKRGEDGSMITETSEQPDPDPILVEAARAAALEAKFSPTLLSGQPVRVTGVIHYNFMTATKGYSVSGGVLNGKAVELPAAKYPPAAKAVKASGTVSVRVLIDENGDVISATAVSGHPLLRTAAAEAARAAKFAPTYLNGVAVKVAGVLTYNFVLPDDSENK